MKKNSRKRKNPHTQQKTKQKPAKDFLSLPKKFKENQQVKDFIVRIERDEKGKKRRAFLEKKGKADGECLLFYPSGKVEGRTFYQEGALHGPSLFYSEEGKLLATSLFSHGKREGICKKYYPSGLLYAEETYQRDRFEGEQRYYYENQALRSSIPYKEGKLHGKSLLFWPNGKVKRETFFLEGKREGLDRIWSEKGVLLDQGSYEKNLPIDWHRRWNERRVLQEELFYHAAERFDKRVFDAEGNLFYERLFIDQKKCVEKKKEEGNWTEKVFDWNEEGQTFS